MAKLWGYVRAVWRLGSLFAVIVWAVVVYALDRRNRRDAGSKARWLQVACRRALKVLAVSIHARGVPAQGAVIVSNHLSYLDILVIASLTPVVFVSKKEVRGWPIFGWFAEKAGSRFIDRGRRGDVGRVGEELGAVIEAGLSVVLFLEGTTTDGSRVLPFKSSLLEPVVTHGWKVVPAALAYVVPAGRSAAQEVCWWGDMTLVPHLLNFMTLSWVRTEIIFSKYRVLTSARKLASDELNKEIKLLFIDAYSFNNDLK